MAKRLSSDDILPTAQKHIDGFHPDVVEAVAKAVGSNDVVVVGMAQNPFVGRARKALQKAGIAFEYVGYGSYFGAWKQRLALKLWAGWPTFPMVFVKGKLFGGAQDLEKAIADGSFQKLAEG